MIYPFILKSESENGVAIPLNTIHNETEIKAINFFKEIYPLPAHPSSYFILGFLYEFGICGLSRSYPLSASNYSMAAVKFSDPCAMIRLINFYRNGRAGVEANRSLEQLFQEMLEEALQKFRDQNGGQPFNGGWYHQLAVRFGCREAWFCLALMYRYGIGMPLNYEKCRVYYLIAAKSELVEAQYNLAIFYEIIDSRTSFTPDEMELIDWVIKLHSLPPDEYLNNSEAQRRLLAIYWYRLGAFKNFSLCFPNLSNVYESLNLTNESIHFCVMGVKNESSLCYFKLGAFIMYEQSLLHGLSTVSMDSIRGLMQSRGFEVDPEDSELQGFAFYLIRECVELRPSWNRALAHLALCHLRGLGTDRNSEEAFQLLSLIFDGHECSPPSFESDSIVDSMKLWLLWLQMKHEREDSQYDPNQVVCAPAA